MAWAYLVETWDRLHDPVNLEAALWGSQAIWGLHAWLMVQVPPSCTPCRTMEVKRRGPAQERCVSSCWRTPESSNGPSPVEYCLPGP